MFNFNMNLFHIFCLICLGVSSVLCAPAGKTFYSEIIKNCPSVESDLEFKEQTLFKSCDDWERISKVNSFTDDTKKDILCMIYFNAFTQYCINTEQINTTVSKDVKYNLSMVCDKLEIISKSKDAEFKLNKIISKVEDCKNLCEDEMGWLSSICSASYYFYNKSNKPTPPSHMIHVPKETAKPAVAKTTDNEEEKLKDPDSLIASNSQLKPADLEPKIALPEPKPNDEKVDRPVDTKIPPPKIEPKPAEKESDVSKHQTSTTPKIVKNGQSVESNAAATLKSAVVINSSKINTNVANNDRISQVKSTVSEKNAPVAPFLKNDPDSNPNLDQELPIEKNLDQELPADKNPLDKMNVNSGEDDGPEFEEEMEEQPPNNVNVQQNEKSSKPMQTDESEAINYTTEMDGDSYFFTYFMLLCIIFIVGYVCYHNKQKILALILEGRKGKRQYRGRRPNSANYHKLDSNLEEAITSTCNKNTNNVIY